VGNDKRLPINDSNPVDPALIPRKPYHAPSSQKYAGAEMRWESAMYICEENTPRIRAQSKVTKVSYINHYDESKSLQHDI